MKINSKDHFEGQGESSCFEEIQRKIDKNVSALAKDANRQEMALIGDDNLELSWPSDDEIFEHLGHL